MWGSFEEEMEGEYSGWSGGWGWWRREGDGDGEGMWRRGGGGRGGFMVVVVVEEEGLRRRTGGVWSETASGSPAAKAERAEPVRLRERQ